MLILGSEVAIIVGRTWCIKFRDMLVDWPPGFELFFQMLVLLGKTR